MSRVNIDEFHSQLADAPLSFRRKLRDYLRHPTERNACHIAGYVAALEDERLFKTDDAASYWQVLIGRTEGNGALGCDLIAEMDNPPAEFSKEPSVEELEHENRLLRARPTITHCDNCGCDWLDNGVNPVGCPYCKQSDDVKILVAQRDALETENERLRKMHQDAYQRGLQAGSRGLREMYDAIQEVKHQDAWGNARLTDALMEAEARAERAEAEIDRLLSKPTASAELRCRKCGERVNVSISSASLVTHWPDGTPRDGRDIASDPEGKLIHDPSEPLRAAQSQPKRRPYNASAALSEYGIFPECDAAMREENT